jgi:hypothetical protein
MRYTITQAGRTPKERETIMARIRIRRFAAGFALALGMLGIAGGSVAATSDGSIAAAKPLVYFHS